MSLILTTNTNPGTAFWGDGAAVVGGATAFVYQPGGVESGNVYTNWDTLVSAYNAWADSTTLPTFSGLREAIILFDSTFAPISVPNPGVGSPVLTLLPGTTFGNPNLPTRCDTPDDSAWVTVTVGNNVQWELAASPAGVVNFASYGIKWASTGRVRDWLVDKAGDVVTSLAFNFTNTEVNVTSAGTARMYTSPLTTTVVRFVSANSRLLSNILSQTNAPIRVPAGVAFNLIGSGKSIIEQFFQSPGPVAASPGIKLDPEVRAALQTLLQLPSLGEFAGPSVSDNVRPSRPITVLTQDQLGLFGGNNIPQIKQAFIFGLATNPSAADTLSITDGTTTETYTFVVAAAAPFEVTIGLAADVTLANLATVINTDSTLWEGSFIQNPQTGSRGVAILRQVQSQEYYVDRAFGTFASGGPFVGAFNNTNSEGTQLLSYSEPIFSALPLADAGVGIAGFSSVYPLVDGTTVIVLDARSDGYYQALNPLGLADSGSWKLVCAPSDGPQFVTAADISARQTRLAVIDATAGSLIYRLATNQAIPGALLALRRTDNVGGNTVTLQPLTGTINGAASITLAVLSGTIVTCDGTNWWSVGAAP